MTRHRDDEDFPSADDFPDAEHHAAELDDFLRALPTLPRQADEPSEFDLDTADIEVDIDDIEEEPAICRAPTRPRTRNAAAVFELQLAAERKISAADGRVPMSERHPGQGTARRFT